MIELPECRRVCVIGHGRSPEGKGWGARIDACDVVIRMWDWHWQDPKTYGSLYTVGMMEAHPRLVDTWRKYNRRVPEKGYIATMMIGWSKCRMPQPSELIDQTRWTVPARKLGTHDNLTLTRGTIAAMWAIEHCEPGAELILVGFDNVRRQLTLSIEEGFPASYRGQPSTFSFRGYKEGSRYQGHHDFAIERPLICKSAEACGVTLSFAQDVW